MLAEQMLHAPEASRSQCAFLRVVGEVLRRGGAGWVQRHASGGGEGPQKAVEEGGHCAESHEGCESYENEMVKFKFQGEGWFCSPWRRVGVFHGHLY